MHGGSICEVVLIGLPSAPERGFLCRAASYLTRQFGFEIRVRPTRDCPELKIDLATWSHPHASLDGFDRLVNSVGARGDFRLTLAARDWLAGAHSAVEVLNRYQRFLPLPNLTPQALPFDNIQRALGSSRELHAETRQAQDTWRWAARLCATLSPGALAGVELLRDAYDLAFFSSGSVKYLEQFGVNRTYAKVRRCLSRMGQDAICHALMTRQPALVSQMMDESLNALPVQQNEAATNRASA